MKVLTFDIEDWYNCDFLNLDSNWDKYDVRIYDGVNRILEELENNNLRGTFFCLGWIAEKHPDVIRDIQRCGHQIGCHSYQHQLSYKFTKSEFIKDTYKAKSLLEDITGNSVNSFRAPGFSITKENTDYFELLVEMGFSYDASIFPGSHDYGGITGLNINSPFMIKTKSGLIKEFPMTTKVILNKNLVFSGGGFFRLYPYYLIKRFTNDSQYLMTYFHPRDFDPEQPILKNLSAIRKFKSYYGLKNAFPKFQKYLSDFDFLNIEEADELINWDQAMIINF